MTGGLGRGRGWGYLAATVVLEVLATLALKASDGFTVLIPAVVSITAYVGTLVVLSLALKTIPMSLAYVIWTGGGTAGVALLGAFFLGDVLTRLSWAGLILVIGGVMLINAVRSPADGGTSHAAKEHTQRS